MAGGPGVRGVRGAGYDIAYRNLIRYGEEDADMVFMLKETPVYADFGIVCEICQNVPFVEDEEGDKNVVTVLENVALESLNLFVKVIYLGILDENTTFTTLTQVRRLGVFFQSDDVIRLCDERIQEVADNNELSFFLP